MELFRFRPPLPERSPRSRPNCWRKRGNSLSYASRSISQWKSCATRSNGPDMYPSRNEAVGIAAFAIVALDRKSTRLNSSHLVISYAVFCLKKKKKTKTDTHERNCHRHPLVDRF